MSDYKVFFITSIFNGRKCLWPYNVKYVLFGFNTLTVKKICKLQLRPNVNYSETIHILSMLSTVHFNKPFFFDPSLFVFIYLLYFRVVQKGHIF